MALIGITGADGFLGFHLRARLHAQAGVDVRLAGRATFASRDGLAAFVRECDAIVHLAGINRGTDDEVRGGNATLARDLAAALADTGSCPRIVFANSTHIDRDTPYAAGKRAAASILAERCDRAGAAFVDLVLPNLFGERGRPFYNSVVATFCHQLARGGSPEVLADGTVDLLHAQRAASALFDAATGPGTGQRRVAGTPTRVSALLDTLRRFDSLYRSGQLPDLRERIDVELFNTYRSYLFPDFYPVMLASRRDARGELVEAVRCASGGQCFYSTTRPGVTRGNHYHRRKFERFLVLQGTALIRVRRLFDTQVAEFAVSGSSPCYVDMPALHTHLITNVGDEPLVTLFWSNEIFDADDPDTYMEPV